MHTLVLLSVLTTCFVSCVIFGFKHEGDYNDEMIIEENREKSPKKTTQQISTQDDGKLQEPFIQTRLEGSLFSKRQEVTKREVSNVTRKRRNPSLKEYVTTTKSPVLLHTTSKEILTKASSIGSFKPSPTVKPFLPNCSSSFSCRGRCQNNQTKFNSNRDGQYFCYCDDECEMFQDCCADLDMFCPLPNTSAISSSAYYHCHSDIWMIDRCPKNWTNKEVHAKCITVFTSITMDNHAEAVPVMSRSGKTYRNRFCAQCHGENSDDIEHYGLDFNCELTPPQGYSTREAMVFLFKYCTKIKWRPKQGQHKRSCLIIREQCYGDPDAETSKKCVQSPTRLLAKKNVLKTYKNIYCAKCLMSNQEMRSSLICGPSNLTIPPYGLPVPFSVIMDIKDGQLATKFNANNHEIQVKCLDNEVYDIFLELCRQVSKAPSTLISSHLHRYRIALWIKAGAMLGSRIRNYNTSMVTNFFGISLGLSSEDIEITEINELMNVDTLIVEMRLERISGVRQMRSSNERLTIESILNFTRPVRFVFKNNSFIIIKATSRLLTCVNVQYFIPKDYVVVHGSSSIYINQTQELLTEKQYFANSTKKHNGHYIPVGSIAVCRQHLPSTLTCNGTYISLDKDEYVMLPNNSVYRNASNTVYNQGEYRIINGSMVVCTEYLNWKKYTKTQSTDESQNDTALRILTSIGLSLSVVCLVFVLVTYLLFGELRTLPGINLMNLSSALLVAHFVWLIGSDQTGSHGACLAIAIILHFSFLASFAWMSIIAFSTWKIFSSMRNASASTDNAKRKMKIRRNLAVGWLPVFVLVLICLILDQSGAVEIRYGGPKGCWINNGRANVFIFVLPIAVSVVWNAVFFGLTVKALRKVAQQTRMVKEQRDYNPVYVKIAMLMGFTWIFGFLASFVSPYFLYPFVALNTFQGVYIAVCFTFTRRVKILYEALISGSKEKARNPKAQSSQVHGKTQTGSTSL